MDLTHYDLRVWDQYYSQWWPLAPVLSVQISKTGGLGIDQATISVPGDHHLSQVFKEAAARPIPLTWELNGVVWSGQITNPVRSLGEDGVPVWTLHVESDDKHWHRLLSRDPADTTEPEIKRGPLASHLVDMVTAGAKRTGLPVYLKVDEGGGPTIGVEARIEDSIASLMEGHVEASEIYVDTRMLLPGHPIPGDVSTNVWVMAGSTEQEWISAAYTAGMWPDAAPNPRLVLPAQHPIFNTPPGLARSMWGRYGGTERPKNIVGAPATDYYANELYWTPFSSERGDEERTTYRRLVYSEGARTATRRELREHAQKPNYWRIGAFVSEWAAGRWEPINSGGITDSERAVAGTSGRLERLDGTKVVTHADQQALDSWIGGGAAYAWMRSDGTWIVANHAAFTAELQRLESIQEAAAGRQTPAPLMWVHGGRDRRHVVFSAAPGGGVEGWETSVQARDAAAVISGMQMDQWQSKMTLDRTSVKLDAQTVGSSSSWRGGPVNVSGMREVTSDVSPDVTVEDSLVAFGRVVGRVDIAQVGPFHYREKFQSISGTSGSDLVVQVHRAWADAQGGTALTLETRGGPVHFGEDRDGQLGWLVGDRVTFVDDMGHQVSEIITGWEFEHQQGELPVMSPVLGREVHRWSPLDRLVDKIVDTEKGLEKARLSPSSSVSQSMVQDTVAKSLEGVDQSIQDLWSAVNAAGGGGSGVITGQLVLAVNGDLQSDTYVRARMYEYKGKWDFLTVTASGTWLGGITVKHRSVGFSAFVENSLTITANQRGLEVTVPHGIAEAIIEYRVASGS